ncbi:MAG: hypothetical protein M1813_005091 [Trichoglossum hirsutum]|nr:MAG: hypothetical protein M1813_005091 [Trichoglossum hirsutum]
MSTSIAIRITERSAASYLPLEWRETRRFSPRLLPKILNSISSVSMSFSLSDLINNPTLLPTFMDLDPATAYGEMGQAVDESMIIKDKEGLGLVVFFKKGLQWPWEPTREVNRVVSGAVTTLVSRYSPPPPSRTDLRHREFNKDVQSNCGVYHFALWVATGQGNAANPKHPTPHQAILSRDILSAAYKTDTVLQFYRSLAPIIQTIGILFEGLDHAGYSRYRANWNYLVGITPLKLLEVSQRQCFLGMAILHGLKVAIHKDKGDVKDASLELAASLFKAIPAVFGLLAAADVRDSKQTEQLMASCNASVKAIYACSWLRAVAYAVMTSMHAVEGLA